MWYVASPYSHQNPMVMQERYDAVAKITADLIASGKIAFSPIVHDHGLRAHRNLPATFDFWKEQDFRLLSACDGLIVCDTIENWESSIGVQAEISYAVDNGIPVVMYSEL